MSSSVAIQNIEIDRPTKKNIVKRNKNQLHKNNSSMTLDQSDEKEEDRLNAILNHVCRDENEALHEQYYHELCDLIAVTRRKKYNSVKKITTGRPLKKSKTPSKIPI